MALIRSKVARYLDRLIRLWKTLAEPRAPRHRAGVDGRDSNAEDRFDRLFRDIDAEFAADEAAARTDEVVERTRYERGRLQLADRLRASRGRAVRWSLRDVGVREAAPLEVGSDWVMAEDRDGRVLLIPLACIAWIAGLTREAVTRPPSPVHDARDLRMVLGRLGRDRARLRLHVGEAAPLHAVVQYAGKDYVEVAMTNLGQRTGQDVGAGRTVPLGALRLVELSSDWRLRAPSGL